MTDDSFSVLIAVYGGDEPEHVRDALKSIFDQTVVPNEVLVVGDGPLPDQLQNVLSDMKSAHPETMRVVSLEENEGLGAALKTGVENCSNDIVARMDADDIALRDRFERQLEYFLENPDIDVLGGYVAEFDTDPDEIDRVRTVPTDPDEVRDRASTRNPINHPTVMFDRNAVVTAGNYRPLRSMQDYELWVRMITQGYTVSNLPEVLVKCRAGSDFYNRRGGLSYARLEVYLQREFSRMGAVSFPRMLLNIAARVPLRIAPKSFRSAVYRTFLRE
ncbi:glycosyltransferase [Halostagnicola bangensis]